MKSLACFVLLQAVLLQTAYSYVISPCGPIYSSPLLTSPPVLASPPVFATTVAPSSVANSLADTLSLLTVSSLLAETLPLPTQVLPVVSTLPLNYGCGCGSTILI